MKAEVIAELSGRRISTLTLEAAGSITTSGGLKDGCESSVAPLSDPLVVSE